MFKIIKRDEASKLIFFLTPILAIILTLIFGALIFYFLGFKPLEALKFFFIVPINNIINTTSFNTLQKLEINQGFNESVNNNKFFSVGEKDQWKTGLDKNQINIIESKFGSIMKKLKYKFNN